MLVAHTPTLYRNYFAAHQSYPLSLPLNNDNIAIRTDFDLEFDMSALFNLMQHSVDYAGLFPPAALPMTQVVDNFSKYLTCKENSMLGRLIIPAAKLTQFEECAKELLPTKATESTWRISALVPSVEHENGTPNFEKFDSAFAAIHKFNLNHAHDDFVSSVVDAVEIKTPNAEILKATISRLVEDAQFKGIQAFLEIPHTDDPTELIATIAEQAVCANVFAKIRTGGVTPDLIPSASEVARFIHHCAKHELGFKATAGLHHPVRAQHKLTYDPDSESATMHGFLNVFAAAAFAFESHLEIEVLETILACTSVDAFEFHDDKLTWNDLSVSLSSLNDTREHGIISFGSCSYVEPTEELIRLPGIARKTVFPA